MDSDEETFYYSSGDDGDDGNEATDYGSDQEPCSNTNKHYTILKEEDIKQLQENDISEVSGVLSVSRGVACTLLLRNNWSLSSVFDKWLVDEEAREAAAISTKLRLNLKEYCKICLETVKTECMLFAACGHPFCADCWKNYFTVSINDGPGCLTLLCPDPKCKAVVGLDIFESVVSDEGDRYKYYKYLHRSYIERTRSRKWCPAPGCEFAVEFAAGGCESYDVTCDCSYKFCWNCAEESHRPVDCKTVAKWIAKNSSEADNCTWITAYTKPCPKCHRNIEKNQGCNHMTCAAPCKFEFCWFCLRPWTSCQDHACNRYNYETDEESLDAMRKYLERYAHYYERWASNHRSRDIALADLNRARKEQIPMLAVAQAQAEGLLQFVVEAWEQIVECRQVLKWTYAYGYYLEAEKPEEKKMLFEYLQGQAEAALEKLHHCAEKEMKNYIKVDDGGLLDFGDFRAKLMCLTAVARNYFQNLVRALENDLSEVECW